MGGVEGLAEESEESCKVCCCGEIGFLVAECIFNGVQNDCCLFLSLVELINVAVEQSLTWCWF